jgi:hypothetical protein
MDPAWCGDEEVEEEGDGTPGEPTPCILLILLCVAIITNKDEATLQKSAD